ncbi:hypothetical protein [Streptomyces sp. NPDC056660]|uniref:hypothetical protein n=1 Tax=Streptomyces sp. NPDC056660 TaxID=3345897 RepID=UPI00369AFF3D
MSVEPSVTAGTRTTGTQTTGTQTTGTRGRSSCAGHKPVGSPGVDDDIPSAAFDDEVCGAALKGVTLGLHDTDVNRKTLDALADRISDDMKRWDGTFEMREVGVDERGAVLSGSTAPTRRGRSWNRRTGRRAAGTSRSSTSARLRRSSAEARISAGATSAAAGSRFARFVREPHTWARCPLCGVWELA